MSEQKQLTNFQKSEIVALKDLMSHGKIDIQLSISYQIVTSFLKHLMIYESIENLYHFNTSRKIINFDDYYIIYIIKYNTRISLTKLYMKTINNISQQILHQLHEMRIKK